MTAPTYDAILFDNDGVLVETTDYDWLVEAIANSLEPFNGSVDEDFIRETIGSDPIPFDRMATRFGVEPEEWWPEREAAVSAIQVEAIREGRKRLYDDVEAIADLQAPLGVVSNNQHETVEFVLEHFGLTELFDCYFGREPTVDGARRKKPDPYYIEQALETLGTKNALYVGDRESDVIAARRAGIDSAFLRRAHRSELSLSVEPTYEYPDLASFVAGFPGQIASD
jgi:HAD superfamily hydrolase (TIGR01549 family)